MATTIKKEEEKMTETPVRLLFVDDEENILRAIKRLLRKKPWEMSFAKSGREALDMFGKNGPFDIVVSDYRMPGMNGVDLLKEVRFHYPSTVRMILSSYTDAEIVLDAINKGFVYKFLTKSSDDGILRQTLEEVVEAIELRRRNRELAAEVEAQEEEIASIENIVCDLDIFELEKGSEELVRRAFEALPVAVMVLSENNEINIMNPEACRLLHVSGPADMLGKKFDKSDLPNNGENFVLRKASIASESGTDNWGEVCVFWERN